MFLGLISSTMDEREKSESEREEINKGGGGISRHALDLKNGFDFGMENF